MNDALQITAERITDRTTMAPNVESSQTVRSRTTAAVPELQSEYGEEVLIHGRWYNVKVHNHHLPCHAMPRTTTFSWLSF